MPGSFGLKVTGQTLVRLRAERDEALAQQAATAEILEIINRSSGDPEPVFDAILERAMRLCDAAFGGLLVPAGEFIKYLTFRNVPARFTNFLTHNQIRARTMFGPEWATGAVFNIADLSRSEGYGRRVPVSVSAVEDGGIRAMLLVPMMKEGAFVGGFTVYRQEVRPFTDRQIALARSFADQAVIAIENARLLGEINARNRDLRESLEYQTATSDVLKIISRSTFDLQPVLDKLVETAEHLCAGDGGSALTLRDGQIYRYMAMHNVSDEFRTTLLRQIVVPGRDTIAGRVALEGKVIHVADLAADPEFEMRTAVTVDRLGTVVGVPMLREGRVVGTLSLARRRVEPFTERQIELVRTFADQAVIAIENARLLTELRESLDRQTAMSEILAVISATPGQVQPVFEKVLECALRLSRAHMGTISRVVDGIFTEAARIGAPSEFSFKLDNYRPPPDTPLGRMMAAKSTIRIDDYRTTEGYAQRNPAIVSLVEQGRGRSAMQVPLLKDGEVVGAMTIYRPEVRPFGDQEATLAEDFAKQAVIAIENARLLTELRESLERQQAMAEVLQVINASPGKLTPVFDAILEKAHTLCGADRGSLYLVEGETCLAAATRGYAADVAAGLRRSRSLSDTPPFVTLRDGAHIIHQPDLRATVRPGDVIGREIVERGGVRTNLLLPLRKDESLLGFISCNRKEVRPFADKEIALLQSFAAQAVIAMDNARLLNEIRQRQAELRVTFDNMGDAVIMFDGEQRLVAWNRNFLHMLDIPEEWLATARTYADFAAYLTERGEFGDTPPPDLGGPDNAGDVRPIRYERVRPSGRVLEARRNPVPGGAGFVFIYADITERKLAERSILAAREAAEHALADLKLAQANLIQSEKMASLGALTAGIAHEIKNPLNFVNNFANLSNELLGELKETAAPAFATLDADKRSEIDETMDMLTGNLEKIQEHGKRADGIVKSMLAHSRGGSGDRREADVNALVEESLNLAYHGARAQDQNFNITLERDYDKAMKPIALVPQDVTRVFLNLCGNGFYAANKRRKEGGDDASRPVLKVATKELGDAVEVRIRDNGTGISPEVKDKLFQPFFTTKPTGEGTGLGLSISYDIVTQQHGGTIAVDSRVGDFTEFTIHLPRKG